MGITQWVSVLVRCGMVIVVWVVFICQMVVRHWGVVVVGGRCILVIVQILVMRWRHLLQLHTVLDQIVAIRLFIATAQLGLPVVAVLGFLIVDQNWFDGQSVVVVHGWGVVRRGDPLLLLVAGDICDQGEEVSVFH